MLPGTNLADLAIKWINYSVAQPTQDGYYQVTALDGVYFCEYRNRHFLYISRCKCWRTIPKPKNKRFEIAFRKINMSQEMFSDIFDHESNTFVHTERQTYDYNFQFLHNIEKFLKILIRQLNLEEANYKQEISLYLDA